MSEMRKITAFLPADDLDAALRNSGEGVSETLREALRQYNHRADSERPRALTPPQVAFELGWRDVPVTDEL
jgi:hypothetical protein